MNRRQFLGAAALMLAISIIRPFGVDDQYFDPPYAQKSKHKENPVRGTYAGWPRPGVPTAGDPASHGSTFSHLR